MSDYVRSQFEVELDALILKYFGKTPKYNYLMLKMPAAKRWLFSMSLLGDDLSVSLYGDHIEIKGKPSPQQFDILAKVFGVAALEGASNDRGN